MSKSLIKIGSLVKVGDLVIYRPGYVNGETISFYAKVIDIIVDNKSYSEYRMVLGWGDKNTKSKITIDVIKEGVEYLNKPLGISYKDLYKKFIKSDRLIIENMIDIWPVNIDREVSSLKGSIDFKNKHIEFLEKNRSLDYKIKKILKDDDKD